jgi:cobalt-zinc-cadmium efflux system membrane fusion protein
VLPPDSPKLGQIRVEEVRTQEVPTNEFVAPGRIELNPNRVSRVLLPLPGQIVSVLVRFGDQVEPGQPVVEVESPDAGAAIAAYLQAEAALAQAQAELTKAEADLDRARDLFANGAIAKKELLHADTALTQARQAVAQAHAAREQNRQRLRLLGLEPGQEHAKLIVRAPIGGKVTEISVVAGEYRNDTSDPLMTIADFSTVWVAVNVPEGLIRYVHVGERLEVMLTAYPGEIFVSRVARISDTVDAQSRTVSVWAELPNPQGRFRPGMFGSIRHAEQAAPKPVVPAAAVIQVEGRNIVYIEEGPGRFRPREVEVGLRHGDLIPILSGLKSGERVVTDGVMLLRGF